MSETTKANDTWVYFCLIDNERFKIGKTTDLPKRMDVYRKWTIDTHEVKLLAAVIGSGANERDIQRSFKHCAITRLEQENGTPCENFNPSWDLTDYIRWLRDQWFCVTSENDNGEDTERESYDRWRPALGHRKRPVDESRPMCQPEMLDFPAPERTADDYWTPLCILDAARQTLRRIDLDPASHKEANKNVCAKLIYTIGDDGLKQPWAGNVWLNPPYGQWNRWVPKLTSEWARGKVSAMCIVSTVSTVTAQCIRPLLDAAAAICITHGRIPFLGLGTTPPDGHVIYYLGSEPERFTEAFAPIGTIWTNATP